MGLCLLAIVIFIGGLGEAFAEASPHVPRAALRGAGVVYCLVAALLLLTGSADLVDRLRARRHST